MKTVRPALTALFSGFFKTVGWTAFWAACWLIFCSLNRVPFLRAEGLLAIGAIGALFLLRSLIWRWSARYEIGATEIIAHIGALWRETRTIPIVQITKIERKGGPFMRLCGLQDLTLGVFPDLAIVGVSGGDELRKFLLDRRDALQEAVRLGDYEIPGVQNYGYERLSRVLDRLERRLDPPAKA